MAMIGFFSLIVCILGHNTNPVGLSAEQPDGSTGEEKP